MKRRYADTAKLLRPALTASLMPVAIAGAAVAGRLEARIAAWLLFASAALAPLPFGSSQPTAIAFWCIVLGVGVVVAPIRSLGAGRLALVGVSIW